jgi:hypothetical protein
MEGLPATETDEMPPALEAPAAGDETPRGAEPVAVPVPGLEAPLDEPPREALPVEALASSVALQLLGLAECGWPS